MCFICVEVAKKTPNLSVFRNIGTAAEKESHTGVQIEQIRENMNDTDGAVGLESRVLSSTTQRQLLQKSRLD